MHALPVLASTRLPLLPPPTLLRLPPTCQSLSRSAVPPLRSFSDLRTSVRCGQGSASSGTSPWPNPPWAGRLLLWPKGLTCSSPAGRRWP